MSHSSTNITKDQPNQENQNSEKHICSAGIRLGRKTCEASYTLLSETAKHYFLGIIWYGIGEIIGGFSKDVIERRTATGSSLSHSWAVVLPLFSGKSSL